MGLKIKRFYKRVEVSFLLFFGIIRLGFKLACYTFKFMMGLKKGDIKKDLDYKDLKNG